ncbi:hypothetical protein FKW77_000823 [Venturia effusa]|uniref:Extracellular serine-rich protein n=1 Tax=Venturia effusa TaxID=50376 RepID=A0A517LQJ3_9PEZI|nr:hypothetical protein FKW77_000823 [Venturia effusa]
MASVVSAANTVKNTILVLARDTASGYSGTSGLAGYGIPYQLVVVPQAGITLPVLNSTATAGNYGGIIVLSDVAYSYAAGWSSALTAAQWASLYAYQTSFGVRMVRLDVYPGPDFGTTTAIAGEGCCDAGVEQLVSISNTAAFPKAGLNTGAGVSTQGLWHYPATITNASIATEIAQFAPAGQFTSKTTAAVINKIGSRQQMAFFMGFATEWSATSSFLQHAYIHWITRGLFVGRRRLYFNTQIDDMHLETDIYQPAGKLYRVVPADMSTHITWAKALNTRLPAGSSYKIEIGHNGNGAVENALAVNPSACTPTSAIEYPEQIDTALEFQKPLGTGTNIWPATPATYPVGWGATCLKTDPLASWFTTTANWQGTFTHISHTFTHAALNNATNSDAVKEITFNKQWFTTMGMTAAASFSSSGIIPPAITGLHNGDVIKAWLDNGITHVVGDNTRPPLLNTVNEFWPLTSTVAANGYAGLTILPRWATTIFYNCDTSDCTVAEWVNTSGGKGDFTALLADAKSTNTRHLLGLHQDGFMFHQANMRADSTIPSYTVGSQSVKSLLQIWVETITQEMSRLTTWPLITLRQDEMATQFRNRQTRDGCSPNMVWNYSADNTKIVGATITANSNTCSVPIFATFPSALTVAPGTNDGVGSDPLQYPVTLSGSAKTYLFSTAIAV